MFFNKIKITHVFLVLSVICILFLLSHINYLNLNPKLKEVEVEKEILVKVEKETIIEVEKIVTTEVYIYEEPEPYYNVTNVEREMLARLLYREAGSASLECQKMVVSVVFNRYEAANGTMTLEEIVYQSGQFTPAPILYQTTPTEINYQAVDEIILNGSILPKYVKYFRADYHFNWEGYVGYINLDGTYFGYLYKDA